MLVDGTQVGRASLPAVLKVAADCDAASAGAAPASGPRDHSKSFHDRQWSACRDFLLRVQQPHARAQPVIDRRTAPTPPDLARCQYYQDYSEFVVKQPKGP